MNGFLFSLTLETVLTFIDRFQFYLKSDLNNRHRTETYISICGCLKCNIPNMYWCKYCDKSCREKVGTYFVPSMFRLVVQFSG